MRNVIKVICLFAFIGLVACGHSAKSTTAYGSPTTARNENVREPESAIPPTTESTAAEQTQGFPTGSTTPESGMYGQTIKVGEPAPSNTDANGGRFQGTVADPDQPVATPEESVASNTGDNVRPVKGDQKANRELSMRIRKAIRSDSSLSARAKSVKILANHNKVTLRGSVDNEKEREQVEAHAKEVNGVQVIDNQLQVKK